MWETEGCQRNPKQLQASPHLSECVKHGRKWRSGQALLLLRYRGLCASAQSHLGLRDTLLPQTKQIVSEMTTADITAHFSSHPGSMLKCHHVVLTPFIQCCYDWKKDLMFSDLQLSSFGEPRATVALYSCS